MDEEVAVTKPVLKMGNPDGDAAAPSRPVKKHHSNGSSKSSHHNSRAPSPASDDYDTGLYRNYQAALPKGTVKRKRSRRDLSPPPSSAYPYDDILKSKHTEDPNASKLPRLGQKYKSKDAFDRACVKGIPEDADWVLGNVAAAEDEIEKRCKHQSGRMCTGDNFRVRCEQQQDGTWSAALLITC